MELDIHVFGTMGVSHSALFWNFHAHLDNDTLKSLTSNNHRLNNNKPLLLLSLWQ